MKRWINWVVIAVVVMVVLAYMATYKVKFTEQAVVTTFGKADESSVQTTPGLRFKVPYVQRETKYDVRQRFLESRPEQVQTKDLRLVVVTTFVTWKVSDPLEFYRKYSGRGDRAEDHYRAAETDLKGRIRSAMSAEISKYNLTDLLSPTQQGSKLGDLEKAIFQTLTSKSESGTSVADLGITPGGVGISSIKFPSDNTKKVFEAMNANRAKIANAAISQGKTQADTIRKSAESDAQEIMVFADRLARQIKTQGDGEAAQYLAQMDVDPKLAVFLKQMEFMRETISRQATLVLATSLPGMEFFNLDNGNKLRNGQIPSPSTPRIIGSTATIEEPADPPAPSGERAPARTQRP